MKLSEVLNKIYAIYRRDCDGQGICADSYDTYLMYLKEFCPRALEIVLASKTWPRKIQQTFELSD